MSQPKTSSDIPPVHPVVQKPVRPTRVVIKIGTSSLVSNDVNVDRSTGEEEQATFLSLPKIAAVVDTVCQLRRMGYQVVLVSSGAVGGGALRLGVNTYPRSVAGKQALAAIGQVHLLGKYETLFSVMNQPIAQVLLTYGNLGNRSEYLSAENTFNYLLDHDVVPIVNENDPVATQALRFGDNDRLSAMVAGLVKSEWLIMLTDVDGLYTDNPNTNPDAKRIPLVTDISEIEETCNIGSAGSEFGTGGMQTKIVAASIATSAGTNCVIMHSDHIPMIADLVGGSDIGHGTVFARSSEPVKGRKQWLTMLKPRGDVVIDNGAVDAMARRASLFAAGVVDVKGTFAADNPLRLLDMEGKQIGVGLTNFSSKDLNLIKGKSWKEIIKLLGYADMVMERANLAISIPKIKTKSVDMFQDTESDSHMSPSTIKKKIAAKKLSDVTQISEAV